MTIISVHVIHCYNPISCQLMMENMSWERLDYESEFTDNSDQLGMSQLSRKIAV